MTSKQENDCCAPHDKPGSGARSTLCPSCGHKGKLVGPVTIESLVSEGARKHVRETDGFRFCSEPECDVAYFHPESAERFLREDVLVAIGQKESSPERTVCYCFDHTVAEIEAEVAATGSSRIPDEIGAKCKQGLDRCEETNPQGSCCLGNVRQVLEEAKGREGAPTPAVATAGMATSAAAADCCSVDTDPPTEEKASRNVGLWATGGAVVSAVFSSACCWLPLLLIAFGASAAGVAGFFEAYRPYLLAATVVLLASGFYLVYFRKERCEPGQACAVPDPKLTRFNKVMLWTASAVVLTFALFPNYVGTLVGGGRDSGPVSAFSGDERLFQIEGMTCAACAQTLRAELSSLPDVVGVEVSYESKTARVSVDPSTAPPSDEHIEEVIKAAGYRGVRIAATRARTVNIRIDGMTCAGCAAGLQGHLASVPGVERVDVDYGQKRATVQLLPIGDTNALLAAITEQGYAGHLEAPSKEL